MFSGWPINELISPKGVSVKEHFLSFTSNPLIVSGNESSNCLLPSVSEPSVLVVLYQMVILISPLSSIFFDMLISARIYFVFVFCIFALSCVTSSTSLVSISSDVSSSLSNTTSPWRNAYSIKSVTSSCMILDEFMYLPLRRIS